MKHFFLSIFLSLYFIGATLLQAQTIAYQGVAVSSLGQLLTNQSISVRLSLFNDTASGTPTYVETQTALTSSSAAFNLQVGAGNALSGTYSSVNLMSNIHYLKVEIKPSGGNYTIISRGPVAQNMTVGWQCGNLLIVNHVAGAVAPVGKNVNYGTVTNLPGETTKCWITSNLGADHQATAVDDATEASAGWYWQFNRKQGYKHDGTTVTPAWSTSGISENSDWLIANDPCAIELGSGWRLPTFTEWDNVNISGNWVDWTGSWNSNLKLHATGFISNFNDGSLYYRGSNGPYWSSMQAYASGGWGIFIMYNSSSMAANVKVYAFSVRCINEVSITSSIPSLTTNSISAINQTSATGGGNVTAEGSGMVITRGICWSTSSNPSITDNHTADGSGTGTFLSNITGLSANTLYHVRAYASNTLGIAYGNDISFTTLATAFSCGSTMTIDHLVGAVAPVSKTVPYGTVTNIPGETSKCWLTSNLGADHQATTVDDATEASAGWYWQFNRKQGYKHDGTTCTPNTTWISSINESSNWLTANDPCSAELGPAWRLPTNTEWTNVGASGNWTEWTGLWNSGLKLHAAGCLESSNGSLGSRGAYGFYWSSVQYAANGGLGLLFYSGGSNSMNTNYKSTGISVRCVKD